MDFVDNVIDRSSGTIRGRAVFANPDRRAHARHVRAHPRAGLADLRRAAGAGRGDRHRADPQVRAGGRTTTTPRSQKYVTLGQLTEDNLRVIKDGLNADDRVVVNGLMRVRPGQKVTPQEPGAAPAAGPQAKK